MAARSILVCNHTSALEYRTCCSYLTFLFCRIIGEINKQLQLRNGQRFQAFLEILIFDLDLNFLKHLKGRISFDDNQVFDLSMHEQYSSVSSKTCLSLSLILDTFCSGGTGGSVVEFSPATREARVRFPASATVFFFYFLLNYFFRLPLWCFRQDAYFV